MHEFALADAVVTTALRVARENRIVAIDRITVSVGELQSIEKDLFEFSLTQVIPSQEEALEETQFVVEEVRAAFVCRACRRRFGRDETGGDRSEAAHFVPELSHAFVRCPECGSPDFEIVAGRGVTLERVEGRTADHPHDEGG